MRYQLSAMKSQTDSKLNESQNTQTRQLGYAPEKTNNGVARHKLWTEAAVSSQTKINLQSTSILAPMTPGSLWATAGALHRQT